MKLHTNTNSIEKSNNFVESNYSIEATAKAFSILSDGLYSNKVKAVVRELSTNAYDSHVQAGCKDKPFDLNLPTSLDNTFSVRDYGTGLSQEDCMSLYTTYFRSNKTDSNDAVGCLGLGSKSPFAYTDQFMVESFFNGEHMTFSAYKSEDGAPVFAMLSSEETNEPNGLKVSFGTNSDDRWEFLREATELFQNFEVVPSCNTELDIIKPKVVIEGTNWRVLDNGWDNTVLMGQVSYPIDVSQFDGEAYKLLDGCAGIQLTAEIGDVDITPSRESLSYNSRTKENLHKLFSNILEEIADKITESVAECKTLWDARVQVVELNNRLKKIDAVSDKIKEVVTWNDQKLFGNKLSFSVLLDEDSMTDTNDVVQYSKSRWRQKVERNKVSEIFVLNADEFTIMFQNIKRGAVGKVKYFLEEKTEGTVFLIRGDESYLQTVLDKLGATRKHVKDVSELVDPPKSSSSTSYYRCPQSSCKTVVKHDDETWKVVDTKVSVKEEDAFYFRVSRGDLVLSDGTIAMHSAEMFIKSTLRCLELAGVSTEGFDNKIFLVTPSTAKTMKLEGRDNWTDGLEYFKSEVQWTLTEKEHIFYKDRVCGDRNWRIGGTHMSWATLFNVAEATKTENSFKSFADSASEYNLSREDKDMVYGIKASAKTLGVWEDFYENLDEVIDFEEKYVTMIEKYPMIALIDLGHGNNEDEVQVVASYIDSFKEKK
jgi:hypothetical protein